MDPNQNSRSPQVMINEKQQRQDKQTTTAQIICFSNKSITEVPLQPLAYSLHGADAVRVPGLAADISQQIAKYDSSEFDDDKEVAGGDAEGFDCKYIFLQKISFFPAGRFLFPEESVNFPVH